MQGQLDLGVEIEEGFDAVAELRFDLFAAAFEDVHCDLGFVAVFESDRGGLHGLNLVGGEKPHSVYQD